MIKQFLLLTVILTSLLTFSHTAIAEAASVHDSHSASIDNRQVILLNNSERNLVLMEMRAFLSSVQQISQGLAENDMTLVSKQARTSGRATQTGMPATLAKKLPATFKKLGHDTHVKFEQLAMDADDLGDKEHTLKQLSTLLQNCVSCHATYRIDI